ncbi:hypothetical protein ULG90_02285 [Halopseudomonas pachastrellae]|nr:hypothetical protein ULG90_02285 [Halopseudomonas pachastrellae]
MSRTIHTEFAVTEDHLLESLTVAEIEARERVADPLGAVPDLPFGHLNTAWQEFLAECEEGVSSGGLRLIGIQVGARSGAKATSRWFDGPAGRFFMTVCKTLTED